MGLAVQNLPLEWVCHVDRPKPRQELTQALSGIHNVVATLAIVKSPNFSKKENKKSEPDSKTTKGKT